MGVRTKTFDCNSNPLSPVTPSLQRHSTVVVVRSHETLREVRARLAAALGLPVAQVLIGMSQGSLETFNKPHSVTSDVWDTPTVSLTQKCVRGFQLRPQAFR